VNRALREFIDRVTPKAGRFMSYADADADAIAAALAEELARPPARPPARAAPPAHGMMG
jgi:hypothetical protein